MSIQWTFIAGYLYLEVGIIIILMLPIASPRRWTVFFRSQLFSTLQRHAAMYFYVFLGVLSLFLLDAIREMRKYSHSADSSHIHLSSEMKGNVKLFRAQRNFYITGFAIFLTFVIRRLITMIIVQAELLEKSENIIKEAEAAKDLAKLTVLAHTLQADESELENVRTLLGTTKQLLEDEKSKTRDLEKEVMKWRLKYEEVNTSSCGKGDENQHSI